MFFAFFRSAVIAQPQRPHRSARDDEPRQSFLLVATSRVCPSRQSALGTDEPDRLPNRLGTTVSEGLLGGTIPGLKRQAAEACGSVANADTVIADGIREADVN